MRVSVQFGGPWIVHPEHNRWADPTSSSTIRTPHSQAEGTSSERSF
jgi:hypothetical protein